MTDLIVISLEAWDDVWRRNQHLVAGLLRTDPGLRVLFVEPPADPLHDLRSGRRPARGHGPTRRSAIERLWTLRPVKWLPRRIDPTADARFTRAVHRAARRMGFDRPLLWINDPRAVHVSSATGWPTLYDITDDWAVADRSDADRARTLEGEARLLRDAEEVVVCSPELVRRKRAARPADRHPIVLIPNAVEVAAYRVPHPRPRDLPAGRVALYAGTVHTDRFDVDLTLRLAEHLRGEVGVVLVGPNLLDATSTARLAGAGVTLLGSRPHDELIGYLQHADVLLVPHVVSEFTDSLDPIKLYEYQAVGRPVVSTAVAGFRDLDDPRVTVASGAEFTAAVALAAAADQVAQSDTSAPVADWGARVEQMHTSLARLHEASR